ncbi:hypothetical protein PQ478_21780 (plasmid) [Alkalihalophilus pseudofirmus]|uniref:hypothetical protein n=1 Tax=Alkalihalophilus pseudofirmus TaxID=79885 RepID=UPI00259B7D9E|nr:hypothetical protein [Alkalihalophilus pseudofirmus]WEG19187.1 hypothetical protein PQ478_21780 [Alkalihalophilus pseudofirmus]
MSTFKLDVEDKKRKKESRFKMTLLEEPTYKESNEIKERKRKVRCDKKTDIKTPVTIEQKQKLMILARQESIKTGERVSVTQMASRLVQKGLFEYESFPDCDYDPALKSVHVKLTPFYTDQLFNYELEWDVSKRVAAARILCFMLEKRDVHEI